MRSFANFSAIICAVLGQLILTAPMIRAAEFPEIDKLPSVAALPDPLVMADGTPRFDAPAVERAPEAGA